MKTPAKTPLEALLKNLRALPEAKRGNVQYVFWCLGDKFTLYRVDNLVGTTEKGTTLKRYFNDTPKHLGLALPEGVAGHVVAGREDKPAVCQVFGPQGKPGYASVAKGSPEIKVDPKSTKALSEAAKAVLNFLL